MDPYAREASSNQEPSSEDPTISKRHRAKAQQHSLFSSTPVPKAREHIYYSTTDRRSRELTPSQRHQALNQEYVMPEAPSQRHQALNQEYVMPEAPSQRHQALNQEYVMPEASLTRLSSSKRLAFRQRSSLVPWT
ncbi:MAG: hypothetical protein ACI82F_000761 [Planctomycetota bacterium]|jgi:hypothetical protein